MFSASKTTAPSSGYNLTKSLRFRASASAYLNRTPSSTTNTKTWTLSFWVKRGILGTGNKPFAWGTSGTENGIQFRSDNGIEFYQYSSGGYNWVLDTTQVFRDPSAWYHFVFAVDTTQATSTNRLKMYVNGVQVTAFSTATYPSQNYDTFVNSTSYAGMIGNLTGQSQYFDGYMTEMNFIDGQQLTPSSFGQNDATTGVWQPKRYTGTYGTNGFYLPFTNTSSTTTLGYDSSGNGNNWTTNNFSLTAGSTYDSMTDVPTLTSATTANYCTWNAIFSGGTLSAGNLNSSNTDTTTNGTMAISSGKFYWEITVTAVGARTYIGVIKDTSRYTNGGWGANDVFTYRDDGVKYGAGSSTSYGATYTTGDVIGVALDMTGNTLTFYKNGTSQGVAFSSTQISGLTLIPMYYQQAGTGNSTANFGQQPFAYTPPTGYVALNTYNLPTSTIVAGNKYMDATTYTGNGSTQSITNAAGFKPDLVWYKNRTTGASHNLFDSVRGATIYLISNDTAAEGTASGVTSFDSNGFSVGSLANGNGNGNAIVGWQWQAGQGTTSSNTNGSITSTVSVNATAGFSVVTYTTPASGLYTVGHGLGVAPQLIINKCRGNTGNWLTWHIGLSGGASNINTYVALNLTDAQATSGSQIWSAPTSTTFGINGSIAVTPSTTYVAYCWAQVAGFSAFGSYTGNGSTDGPFIYTGFRPKWIMIKRTDAAYSWWINDSARDPYNVAGKDLAANLSDAESSDAPVQDFLSNGFKLRTGTYPGFNASGGTYIYAAFAENPFKNALAR